MILQCHDKPLVLTGVVTENHHTDALVICFVANVRLLNIRLLNLGRRQHHHEASRLVEIAGNGELKLDLEVLVRDLAVENVGAIPVSHSRVQLHFVVVLERVAQGHVRDGALMRREVERVVFVDLTIDCSASALGTSC